MNANKPTHHAVIDEHGEILFGRQIGGLLDAEKECENYISQCNKDQLMRHCSKHWTVKGVTVHE